VLPHPPFLCKTIIYVLLIFTYALIWNYLVLLKRPCPDAQSHIHSKRFLHVMVSQETITSVLLDNLLWVFGGGVGRGNEWTSCNWRIYLSINIQCFREISPTKGFSRMKYVLTMQSLNSQCRILKVPNVQNLTWKFTVLLLQ
jgi:hypothetical protein